MSTLPVQSESGRYSASLLGTIRSNLEGLQGYDVMALELIQNADDAGAEEIVFDVTADGLSVWNSGSFSYCGTLRSPKCPRLEAEQYACDFHRITEVASGGKLRKADNIGRFGIGFVSTYQITDCPTIESSGASVTLYPDRGEWHMHQAQLSEGTSFRLPWARDPKSSGRLALGLSPIDPTHISRVSQDIQNVLKGSLLFLRNVKRAELRNNGAMVFSCQLDRGSDSELIVSFKPEDYVEQWYILRSDAAGNALPLFQQHPTLRELNRATAISIGIRVEPEPLADGSLYAFLPTNQSSGLPVHINADFFPEPDRKAVIFSGHQHQQAWNEMLIDTAATRLASDLPDLARKLGADQLWRILNSAYDLSKSVQVDRPKCFINYWKRLEHSARSSAIVQATSGEFRKPSEVFFSNPVLTGDQVGALTFVGCSTVHENLRAFRNVLLQVGVQQLSIEKLASLISASQVFSDGAVVQNRTLFQSLWSVINQLLVVSQNRNINQAGAALTSIPFLIDQNGGAVSPKDAVLLAPTLQASTITDLFPFLRIASLDSAEYPQLSALVSKISLVDAVNGLSQRLAEGAALSDLVPSERQRRRDFYSLLATLDAHSVNSDVVYQRLSDLPIWPTSKHLVRASEAMLPGEFQDPTGDSDLLDPSFFTPSVREFVEKKLGVHTQSLESFVRDFLPRFIGSEGPKDAEKHRKLLVELAKHPRLVDDEQLRSLIASLPVVPTCDGKWIKPGNAYFRTDELALILGERKDLWIDLTRGVSEKSTRGFLTNLGIRQTPSPDHVVDRMFHIVRAGRPAEDAVRSCAAPFYELCRQYSHAPAPSSELMKAIMRMSQFPCLPAEDDSEHWHIPRNLYAPFRSEAFKSQVKVLAFRDTQRLDSRLLQQLGITMEPSTALVIAHLLSCIETNTEPHFFTYQILNERSGKDEYSVSELRTQRCIYVESEKAFVHPSRVFWTSQPLGKYAYTVSPKVEPYRAFFRAVGVKDHPSISDYVDILLELVERYYTDQRRIDPMERGIYHHCLNQIALGYAGDADNVARLSKAPCINNLLDQLSYPDEVMFKDSEWHAGLFDGALDGMLCSPPPELFGLFRYLGVENLSDLCEIKLDVADGDEQPEDFITRELQERSEIIDRLLHDKPISTVTRVNTAISDLNTISCGYLQIQEVLRFGTTEAVSPSKRVPAFYDQSVNVLHVARPVNDRIWPHVITALFHQLLKSEPASDISKLALCLASVLTLPVDEGHLRLTEAGIPLAATRSEPAPEVPSAPLEEIGGSGSTIDPVKPPQNAEPITPPAPPFPVSPRDANAPKQAGATSEQGVRPADLAVPSKPSKPPRPEHKQAWDARLVSYVRHASAQDKGTNVAGNEQNLAVEIEGRKAICDYELLRGRIPEQMPQQHPGFDILSVDVKTKEERRIEVKALSGEWNQRGVGISRTQFSNAEEFGNGFWLYVVEFATDPPLRRIHAIQNPAHRITDFMFDGNWREIAHRDTPDPTHAFIPGTTIQHRVHGKGNIQKIEMRGIVRMLHVEFAGNDIRIVPLNLSAMEIIEEHE